ncbi:nucleoside deaminase [Streptomyces roseicoloratus]|uniref:Nucleoside deaminase n=1 Tax=Streptomyces roseicoloratus TaxID=2508722 RepID=A0ABY9RVE2_9ACTN|nr:nucleoside deaminase [Streptomyces roseicoloratus]WMX45709.1 nucleoside deaminase [Streptomyces roseicoloratus]
MPLESLDQLAPHVEEAVRISREHVAEGGIPFSGIVVRDGRVLGTGFNRVAEDNDPTAHAEVVALREATRKAGRFGVAGATLIASGEPCALCYMAALYFNVDHIVYAADRQTAAAYGFDYAGSYSIFSSDPTTWRLKVTHAPVEGHEVPFQEFLTRHRAGLR